MTVDWQFITAIRLPLFSTNRFTLGFQSIWYSIFKVIDLAPLSPRHPEFISGTRPGLGKEKSRFFVRDVRHNLN
jgi:hypothetical protein